MRIFEAGKKLNKRAESVVSDFAEDPELEPIVKEYADLSRKSVAMSLDRDAFSTEDIQTTRARLKQVEEDYGERLREYLKLYIGLPMYEEDDWHRWFTAQEFKN